MAFRINCGKPEHNEVAALNRLAAELSDDWALFTSVPRHITGQGAKGREIDALALSPKGAVVIELKNFGGLISVTPVGEWYVAGKMLTDSNGRPQYPLQQAGKAAQTLKSALGVGYRSVYIEACAVASAPSARIQFSDPSRMEPVMALDDAIAGIEALARRTRGVSYPILQRFFALIGHKIPDELEARWRAEPPVQNRNVYSGRRKQGPVPRRYDSGNSRQPRHQNKADPILLWILLALLVGSLIGWLYLTSSGST